MVMEMGIEGWTDGFSRMIWLCTEGTLPEPRVLALFFCRSVTMLGEYFLVGPTEQGRYLAFDDVGQSLPQGPVHRDFLTHRDRWKPMELPELKTLLALG